VAARRADATSALYAALQEKKIYVSLRNNALRIAPYLYNTPEDIERFLRAIAV
jgi:selenocysteine lyase/cysteine desulfurase